MQTTLNPSRNVGFADYAANDAKRQTASLFMPQAPFAHLPRVSIVMPTLDERENLPYVISRIPQWVHELVIVDGQSQDGTVQVAKELWPNNHIVTEERGRRNYSSSFDRQRKGTILRLVSQRRKGKGEALRCGFQAATGEIVVIMDADGSNDPREITSLVGALLSGADVAKGSRFLQGGGTADMPFYRRVGNWGFVMMVRLFFGCRFSDLNYGFLALWRNLVPELELDGDGFEIETMINVRALKLGAKIAEVPSFEDKRIFGESRLKTFPDGWRVLKTILRERFSVTAIKKSLSRQDTGEGTQDGV